MYAVSPVLQSNHLTKLSSKLSSKLNNKIDISSTESQTRHFSRKVRTCILSHLSAKLALHCKRIRWDVNRTDVPKGRVASRWLPGMYANVQPRWMISRGWSARRLTISFHTATRLPLNDSRPEPRSASNGMSNIVHGRFSLAICSQPGLLVKRQSIGTGQHQGPSLKRSCAR